MSASAPGDTSELSSLSPPFLGLGVRGADMASCGLAATLSRHSLSLLATLHTSDNEEAFSSGIELRT